MPLEVGFGIFVDDGKAVVEKFVRDIAGGFDRVFVNFVEEVAEQHHEGCFATAYRAS
jgi:hypothetical protein